MLLITLGEMVSEMVSQSDVSAAEVARRCGVTRTTISVWSRSSDPARDHATEIVAVGHATGADVVRALIVAGCLTENDLAKSDVLRRAPSAMVLSEAGRRLGEAIDGKGVYDGEL